METDLPDGGEVLAHHGVKGMHWGVIRKKASAGRVATAKALRKAGRGTVKTVSGTVSATRRGVKTVQKAHERHQERTIARTQRKAEIKARKKFAKKGYRKISDEFPGWSKRNAIGSSRPTATLFEVVRSLDRSSKGLSLRRGHTPGTS